MNNEVIFIGSLYDIRFINEQTLIAVLMDANPNLENLNGRLCTLLLLCYQKLQGTAVIHAHHFNWTQSHIRSDPSP